MTNIFWNFSPLVAAIPWQGWLVLFLTCIYFYGQISERISIDGTAIFLISSLVILFTIAPLDNSKNLWKLLLTTFANPSLIAVMCLLSMGHGLYRSGAIAALPQLIFKRTKKIPGSVLIALLLFVAAIVSMFMNNTPVVSIFIPLMMALALRFGQSASQILMPLSYLCILGGMTTLIGSSTNVLAADIAMQHGIFLDVFSLAPMGIMLFIVGALYVFFVLPYFLPYHASPQQSLPDATQYFVRVVVHKKHALVNKTVINGVIGLLGKTSLHSIDRQGYVFVHPFEQITIQKDDILTVAGTRTQMLKHLPYFMAPSIIKDNYEDPALAEVLVPPDSNVIGRHIGENYGSFLVLGIQRRNRMLRGNWRDILLERGDTLLMFGDRKDLNLLQAGRELIVLEGSIIHAPLRSPRPAVFIFLCSITSLLLDWMPLVVAALFGACGMLLVKALNVQQFFRSMNLTLYLLMVSGLVLALALEKTGLLHLLANSILSFFYNGSVVWLASGLFLLASVMTNLINNTTTALLCIPLVLEMSVVADVPALPLVLAVIYGANCSFATPISYQTNLLIMSAGHYRYKDYVLGGTPLVIILWLAFTLLFSLGFGI